LGALADTFLVLKLFIIAWAVRYGSLLGFSIFSVADSDEDLLFILDFLVSSF